MTCGGCCKKNECRICYNAYMRTYLAKRYKDRREMAKAELGGRCAECGSIENLEFDHQDRGEKKFNLGKIWLGELGRLKAELKKCQLLCHDCHLRKTSAEIGVPHGGGKRGKHECSCQLCIVKRREYMRDLRMNAKLKAAGEVEGFIH